MNKPLSELQAQALAFLQECDGRINCADENGQRLVDDIQTLADVAANLRAHLVDQMRIHLSAGKMVAAGLRMQPADPAKPEGKVYVPRTEFLHSAQAHPELKIPMLDHLRGGGLTRPNWEYFELRGAWRHDAEAMQAARAKGGGKPVFREAEDIALELAALRREFPGEQSLAKNARDLIEFARTETNVFSHKSQVPSQRTVEERLKVIFPPDGKTPRP